MASALYPKGKGKFLDADIDMPSDTIKCSLIASAMSYSASDEFWSDISTHLIGTSATMGTKTTTDNVYDAADISYSSVSGAEVGWLVIWKDTATPSTSPLIAAIDITAITPNGGDINITWDNGANKIFAL